MHGPAWVLPDDIPYWMQPWTTSHYVITDYTAGGAFILLGNQATAHRSVLYILLVILLWGVNILTAVLAAYTAEVYPTVIRARGSGLAAGTAKAGGVLILTLAVVAFVAPSIKMTAIFAATPLVVAVIALACFGRETRHKRLEQITAEEMRGRYAPTPAAGS